MHKFSVNEVVLYQNGNRFELGIVKEIVIIDTHDESRYDYRVWYHTGDTTALTSERDLHKVANDYAFTIMRKQVDPDIRPRTCKEMAVKILEPFMFYGKTYYKLEDWLTETLSRRHADFPKAMDDEYLRAALRLEVIDYIITLESIHGIESSTSDTVESIVDKLVKYVKELCIDSDFFHETVIKEFTDIKEVTNET